MPSQGVRTSLFGKYFQVFVEKGPVSTGGTFFSTGKGHSCTGTASILWKPGSPLDEPARKWMKGPCEYESRGPFG